MRYVGFLGAGASVLVATVPVVAADLAWRNGPELPVGVGGHAAAVVGGRILVAGGTAWENGQKRWLRAVWALDPRAGAWEEIGALPEAIGYGVGIAGDDGLTILGGSDGEKGFTKCWRLSLRKGELVTSSLPGLPEGRVYAAGDRIGRTLYVVGGTTDPARLQTATNTLLALDLDRPGEKWKALPPLPGQARCIHTAVACGDALYVFGGAYLTEAGSVENLADAYRYLAKTGQWERLADMPHANRGLTAASDGKGRIVLIGGYTATAAESEGKPDDFGFTADLLRYDVATGRYERAGGLPRPVVGAVPVPLRRDLHLLGGEPVKKQRGNWDWILPDPWR